MRPFVRRRPFHPSLAAAAALLLPAVLLLLPTLAGGAPPGDLPPEPEGFVLEGDAEAGKEVFLDVCAICHGDTGAGDGKLSANLEPPPGNLQERVDEISDWHLLKVIEEGGTLVGKSPVMVGFRGRLDDQELRDVAVYTKSLGKLDE